jgi:hypothetical protein
MFLQGVKSSPPEEYLNYLLCVKFGWDYEQLMKQPANFIRNMLLIMSTEEKIKRWLKQM